MNNANELAARLRELAKAATPGPFRHNVDNEQVGDVSFPNGLPFVQVQQQKPMDAKQRDVDAAYIAEVLNAAPVLLDALQAAQAEIEALNLKLLSASEGTKDREHAEKFFKQAEQLLTANEATLHQQLQAAHAEIEQLQGQVDNFCLDYRNKSDHQNKLMAAERDAALARLAEIEKRELWVKHPSPVHHTDAFAIEHVRDVVEHVRALHAILDAWVSDAQSGVFIACPVSVSAAGASPVEPSQYGSPELQSLILAKLTQSSQAREPITHEALTDLIAASLSGTYHCTRVWSAWGVGTMSQDDFEPVDQSDTPAEIATAVLAAINSKAPE